MATEQMTVADDLIGRGVHLLMEQVRAEERERCATLVEEQCIYMVGRIQAAAIARKIRSADGK